MRHTVLSSDNSCSFVSDHLSYSSYIVCKYVYIENKAPNIGLRCMAN